MALKEYTKHFFKVINLHSVPPPTPSPLSDGGLSLLQIFKKGGLTGSRFLEGGCWKGGGNFFELGEEGITVFT